MKTSVQDVLPRNMSLKAFDPHRATFECKHEADYVPPIDPEAERWFQEGMRLTSRDLWPNQRDYPMAVGLWGKAAERKHWKAMINLASVLIEGDGTDPYVVPPDTERAVKLIEEAMRLEVPAAFDMMGTLHQRALGVNGDISRAYAFWELAADMGNPNAQAVLGDALRATHDSPSEGFWANRRIGLQMLECSFSQGYGKGAFFLGSDLEDVDRNYARALVVLHEGTKMGSEESANSLSSSFGSASPVGGPVPDTARAERYSVLGDALYLNPDLRFPNLDKVLPLPPAPLPKWDGNKKTLIDAAKAVVPTPGPVMPASSPASQRTGRAHVPEGYVLPDRPRLDVPAQYETTAAPVGGYWLAQLKSPRDERHAQWNAAQWPMRYAEGELFDRTRPGLVDGDGRILFYYLGEAVAVPFHARSTDPRALRGVAREVAMPEAELQCRGDIACPATGIWVARVADDHPQAATFNQWHRQSYVTEGRAFLDPRNLHLDVRPSQVTWQWYGEANEVRPGGMAQIGMNGSVSVASRNAAPI